MRYLLAFLLLLGQLAAQEARQLTILHTNDLHARLLPLENGRGGFARLTAIIRQQRTECRACLLLNAGDLAQGSPVSTMFQGLPVYEIANLMGFSAATLGNHDFDYGWEVAKKFVQMANYPIVAANIADENGRLFTKPYVVLDADGLRVAVIGIMTADLAFLSTPRLLGPYRVEPVLPAVRRYAAEVRDISDVIIVLAHATEQEEVQLLNEVPEISAIITGHLHRGLPAPLEREGRVLVRAKGYAEELGRLDMLVDPSKKKMIQWNWTPVPVAPKTREAPDVAEQVKRWEAEVARQVDVPIGESSRQFSKAETREFIVEAMCRELGTDFAFVNAGGVRDILPKGRVLARHVWNIMPFDNRAVVGRFKGNQLPLSVTQGRNVDPNREYTLATTDFTAVNQSAPGELGSKGLMFPQEGPLLRDLLIDYIKKQKRVGDSAATPGAASRPD